MSTNDITHWKPGEQIIMRSTWDHKIQAAWPVTVVDHSPKALVLYLATGTVYKLRQFHSGAEGRMPIGEWEFIDSEWYCDMVRIKFTGDQHAYLGFWDRNRRFDRWYVNIESEYKRTRFGVDFTDHFLDLVITANTNDWYWKDEAELSQAVSLGLLSKSQGEAILAEGHSALERFNNNAPPFGQGWEQWSRDPEWLVPSLPADWNEHDGRSLLLASS